MPDDSDVDEERAPTQDVDAVDVPAAVEPTPSSPLPRFTRYQVGALLGQGGMGKVFRAWDPRLRRSVALKIVAHAHTAAPSRLLQEAQAQARVEHEHICHVYEVGEADGVAYIAMQLIDGKTLAELAGELSLHEKVRIMEQAARAVHAAHRQGLIHRDLKPSNIMLERGDDGWKPFVMDFGVARELANPGGTATGDVIGTPQYMAPEQARGGTEHGPKADVYGLGATLYRVLTGRPPFEGTAAEVLTQVLTTEPSSVRRTVPALPIDLETITARCLEKDPARRYESAAALADDLRRHLDGEPILARRASVVYRLGKRARKHRALVTVVAVALVGAATLSVLWLRARAAGARHAALATHFAEEIERARGDIRRAYTLPHHDVRPDKKAVLERLDAIASAAGREGGLAEDVAEVALGRGYLSLNEPEKARAHLEAAWRLGRHGPDVAFALGRATGAIYGRRLLAVERIPDALEREAARKKLEASLRDVALEWLRRGAGQGDDPAYGEALIALYEKRYPAAVAGARLARARVPWLYEASIVEGDAYTALSRDKWRTKDYDGAVEEAVEAVKAYRNAADIARSDASVHTGICAGSAWLMVLDFRRGAPSDEHHRDAAAACALAIGADPDFAPGHYEKLRVSFTWGSYLLGAGKDPRAELDDAVAEAGRALALEPTMVDAYLGRGNALRQRSLYEEQQGVDPRPTLLAAIESFDTARRIEPRSYMVLNDLGISWALMHQFEEARGVDPARSLDRAMEALTAARQASPDNLAPVENLMTLRAQKATYELEHGTDPRRTLAETITALGEVSLKDNDVWVASNLGGAHLGFAEAEAALGGDPTAHLELARQAFERALAIKPTVGAPYEYLARVELMLGRWQLGRGMDASTAIAASRKAALQAIANNAPPASSHTMLGRVELLTARAALEAGRSPASALTAAEAALRGAGAAGTHDAAVAATEAEVARVRAEWRYNRGEKIDADLAAGLEAAGRSEQLNGRDARPLATKGRLELLAARARRDKAAARRAVEALSRARNMSPILLGPELDPLLAEAQRLAVD